MSLLWTRQRSLEDEIAPPRLISRDLGVGFPTEGDIEILASHPI